MPWHARQGFKQRIEFALNSVGEINTVHGYSLPDFKEIILRLRRNLVEHLRRVPLRKPLRLAPDTRGPSLTNIDVSLVRNLVIHNRLTMQIRGEAFNLFNVPHFFQPSGALLNNQFGQISSTSIYALPRVLQFALKVKF